MNSPISQSLQELLKEKYGMSLQEFHELEKEFQDCNLWWNRYMKEHPEENFAIHIGNPEGARRHERYLQWRKAKEEQTS